MVGRRSWQVGLGGSLCGLLTPSSAFASDQAGSEPILYAVGFILLIVVAYLVAHFVVERLQRRFLMKTGFEYLLLGILVGPVTPVFEALSPERLTSTLPLIALATGWFGLARGTDFNLRMVSALPAGTLRVVLFHHLITGALVGGSTYLALQYSGLFDVSLRTAAMISAVIGCGAATDSAPVSLLFGRYRVGEALAPLLRNASHVSDVLMILLFGIVFCIFREPSDVLAFEFRTEFWAVISVALGALLGLLFSWFLGGDESENARLLALVGIITFASGAAFFLKLSALQVCMVLGVVLVTTSRYGSEIQSTLDRTEAPMTLVLLVLAGALWSPPPLVPTLIGIAAFILLRMAGKWIGSGLAAVGSSMRRDLYRGLLSHSEVTLAMAVSFKIVYYDATGVTNDMINLAYSILIASFLLNSLFAPRMLRALLVDAGDIRSEGVT